MAEEIEYLTLREIDLVQKAYAKGREDERKHLQDFFNAQSGAKNKGHDFVSIQSMADCDPGKSGDSPGSDTLFDFHNFFCENCGCELSAFEIENFEGLCLDCGGKR